MYIIINKMAFLIGIGAAGLVAGGILGKSDQSVEDNYKLFRKTLIENTTEFITNNSNEAEVSIVNKNLASVSIGGDVLPGCPIKIGQSITSETVADARLTNQQISELQNQIKDEVSQDLNRNVERARGSIPNVNAAIDSIMGTDQSTKIKTDIEDIMENITKTVVTTTNYNRIRTSSYNENTGELKIGGNCGDTIDIDNNIVSSIVATVIIDNVIDAMAKNEVLRKLDTAMTTKVKDKTEGISDVLDSLGGPWVVAGIASCVCCFVILIIVLVMMSGGGANKNIAAMMRYR